MALSAQSQGPVVRLVFNEPDVAGILAMGFHRLSVERSEDAGLTWVELTRPSDRLVLEQSKPTYQLVDRGSNAAFMYRTRYVSEDGCLRSDPSDSVEASGLLLLQILTVAQLKERYLFGVSLTNDAGNPLPDSVFEHYILTAIDWIQTELDIPILPTQFVDEAHDYHANDVQAWCIAQLDNYPVISVESFGAYMPNGQLILEYPEEWVHVDRNHGLIRIVPAAGVTPILSMVGPSYLPINWAYRQYVPDAFKATYTAGFEQVPHDILDLIGMFAALGPFNIFGDLIAGAGIASLSTSIDGLSQSVNTTSSATNSGYGARIIQYLKQIKQQIPMLRRKYKGIRMTVA